MRSFSNISKILSESKKKTNIKIQHIRSVLALPAQESEEKCKENYFYEVDKFLSCSANDFLDAFPILVVIEKNKDTFLGAFLIKNNEKILKKDDIRFTDYLMEILKKGHVPSIDYTSPSLGRYCG